MPRGVNSVHLTLLRSDGGGKADIPKPKIIVGSPSRPIVVAPPGDSLTLAITEGIEDALALHQALGVGAWAAGSAGFMPRFASHVPDWIEAVVIELHPDDGRRSAEQLADMLRDRAIEVLVREAIA